MKCLFICVVGLVVAATAWSRTFNMKELGADPRGIESCTGLINQTIEKASFEGGGTIYFPAGVYLTATIHMKSNITLYVESGAVLRFSDRFEDYLPFVKIRWEGTVMNTLSPLIYAHDAENLTITGRGTLDGNGFKWWSWEKETRELIKKNGGKLPALNKLQRMWEEANEDLEISDYYKPSLKRRMFRPPFIQFYECNNVLIENVKIVNSPFWTINPAFCDNVTVHGVTIYNPSKDPKGPNTDGINPSSCRNVRISDCFISVGDDCITIKSGRDADGRKYGKACENITITNCVMLSGHGGVVIGSEMSGGVRRVTISNCVFDGTDSGIRLKSSRGRGGVVEELRVDNIVMKNIQRNAFIFDLFYDKESKVEPVSERTPVFRNIHLSNITGSDIKQIGYIKGIEEMPVQGLSFSNINMQAEVGFIVDIAEDIRFDNVDFSSQTGSPWQFSKCTGIVLNNIRSKYPADQQAIITFDDVDNAIINGCFQIIPVKEFYKANNSRIIEGNNYWKKENSNEPEL
ncbi:glycoside hydrolase family 28 protein [Bacteroides sp. HF-5092]|uniref:glycoside hydrolase family 28 protein n=1 Tax=Bacteroides TaxID=816 RepID=UPI0011775D25|nr:MULTISPECIES: glycoside hydrolase family 28 protein [Bacteroides]TRX47880.1 glycoside hydrolase family 28 protein [Bacteroides sp. HF-5092]